MITPRARHFCSTRASGVQAVIDLVLKYNLVTGEICDRVHPVAIGRRLACNHFGKTWQKHPRHRLAFGTCRAPASIAQAQRPVHDYMTICTPTPLQRTLPLHTAENYYLRHDVDILEGQHPAENFLPWRTTPNSPSGIPNALRNGFRHRDQRGNNAGNRFLLAPRLWRQQR